jgi:HEPN superfamily RiboL-PSP-like protein
MLIEVERRLRSIDFTLGSLRDSAVDEAILAIVFQHLCIRMSGNLEVCITEILNEYTRGKANPQVRRAVERMMGTFQNPGCQRIVNLLSNFNSKWGKEFDRFATDGEIRDKIDSIAANRNLIAQGRDTGISATRIADFNLAHKRTLQFIHNMILT